MRGDTGVGERGSDLITRKKGMATYTQDTLTHARTHREHTNTQNTHMQTRTLTHTHRTHRHTEHTHTHTGHAHSRTESRAPERRCDVLCVPRRLVDGAGYSRAVGGIECLVDLVKEVKRPGVAPLDGKDERKGHE